MGAELLGSRARTCLKIYVRVNKEVKGNWVDQVTGSIGDRFHSS